RGPLRRGRHQAGIVGGEAARSCLRLRQPQPRRRLETRTSVWPRKARTTCRPRRAGAEAEAVVNECIGGGSVKPFVVSPLPGAKSAPRAPRTCPDCTRWRLSSGDGGGLTFGERR